MCTVLLPPGVNPTAVNKYIQEKHFGKQFRNIWKVFEMRCWRRVEKISLTDRVRSVAVLQKVKRKRNPYIKRNEETFTALDINLSVGLHETTWRRLDEFS